MAYTIGRYGPTALGKLAGLIATFYLTSIVFVVVVLGSIARIAGFSIFKYLGYIKDELDRKKLNAGLNRQIDPSNILRRR